jgi:shikimate dehydrogenase
MGNMTGLTRIMFIMADPVFHLRGSAMFNAHFQSAEIDALCVPLNVLPTDLASAVSSIRAMQNLAGFKATKLHKVEVMPFLDEVREWAERIKAVNFVKRTANGRLIGNNLDAAGFIGGLHSKGISAQGKRVLQIGAGGAGRATAFAIARDDAFELEIENRNRSKAEQLAADIQVAYPGVTVRAGGGRPEDFDIIVNSTSLGLKTTDEMPCDVSRISSSTVVYDIIVNPRVTHLMAVAESRGATVIGGAALLNSQMSLVGEFLFGVRSNK